MTRKKFEKKLVNKFHSDIVQIVNEEKRGKTVRDRGKRNIALPTSTSGTQEKNEACRTGRATVMRGTEMSYECPKCNEWIEILPTTTTDDFRCPWCNERLRLDVDYDNPGMSNQRDLSKLVTFNSHWDDNV